MSDKRRLLDRLFQLGAPDIVEDFRPAPMRLADGVWSLERRLRMPGAPVLPSRTTIVRLNGGGDLALISPPPPHAETFAAIDALGTVEALLAPNSFHYLYVADAARRYPHAKLYLAPGLQGRIASLPPGADLATHPLSPDFDHAILDAGRGISEVILFHRHSRILFLTDSAFNLVHFESLADQLFWRLFGVPAEFGPSRTARMLLLKSSPQTAQVLRRVLAWPFERIVVAHGEIVQTDAHARFERAFARYLG
jgi:hypothetical protein